MESLFNFNFLIFGLIVFLAIITAIHNMVVKTTVSFMMDVEQAIRGGTPFPFTSFSDGRGVIQWRDQFKYRLVRWSINRSLSRIGYKMRSHKLVGYYPGPKNRGYMIVICKEDNDGHFE